MAKKPIYSGSGDLTSSIILFVICFAILIFGLYAFGTYPDGGAIWFAAGIIIFSLAFAIPLHLLSSKTNGNVKGEVDQNML